MYSVGVPSPRFTLQAAAKFMSGCQCTNRLEVNRAVLEGMRLLAQTKVGWLISADFSLLLFGSRSLSF